MRSVVLLLVAAAPAWADLAAPSPGDPEPAGLRKMLVKLRAAAVAKDVRSVMKWVVPDINEATEVRTQVERAPHKLTHLIDIIDHGTCYSDFPRVAKCERLLAKDRFEQITLWKTKVGWRLVDFVPIFPYDDDD
jgi:hypothetical protein